MKMWKWNVNTVVLLYYYLELASNKSTEIKTSFLGLEPCNTDMTLLFLFSFYNQQNLGKILVFYADEILVMGTV